MASRTRILNQTSIATGQTYSSSGAGILTNGYTGAFLELFMSGTGTAEFRVNVYGSEDGSTKKDHETERTFVLSPQGGNAFPGFMTVYAPFPYIIVDCYTDAVIPGGSPALEVWCTPIHATPMPNVGSTYGQNSNIQGTARFRARGAYTHTSGVLGVTATGANEGVFAMFNPSGSGVRTVIRRLEITGNHAAAAAASPPTDVKVIYCGFLASDPTAITATTLATQRANDTVQLAPLTTLRAEDGGDTATLHATTTRPILSWVMPTAPSNFAYVWEAKTEIEEIVLRPTQGIVFYTPVAFDANEIFYAINASWAEQA